VTLTVVASERWLLVWVITPDLSATHVAIKGVYIWGPLSRGSNRYNFPLLPSRTLRWKRNQNGT